MSKDELVTKADFANQRLQAENFDVLSGLFTFSASTDTLTFAQDRQLAQCIADRWNACADALAELEEPARDDHDMVDAGSRALAILRRAVHGEE